MECARELDWVAKLQLLQGFRERDGLDWSHPRLGRSTCSTRRPQEKGLFNRLVAEAGSSGWSSEKEVLHAVENPPEDTRAYFRGRCLAKYGRRDRRGVLGLGDLRAARRASLQRVPMLEPLRGAATWWAR